ncbi:AbrB family transcriptional regulator [Priestia megaterium]|nr:AbrB family transcriptional regulator [Priestia megaterium]
MKGNSVFFQSILFILISSIGGIILSLSGMSIGWMVGTLVMATILAFSRPVFLNLATERKGIPKYWLYIGQAILGIELGQKINQSVLVTFTEHWSTILIILLVSVGFSLISGFVLWKWGQTDLLTSFFGTAPGGMSAMPGIAEEVGANTAVVSIIQAMRVFLVVLTVPLFVSYLEIRSTAPQELSTQPPAGEFEMLSVLWTVILAIAAIGGYYVGKYLRFPAPWLVGSMVTVAIVQMIASAYTGHYIVAWWPHIVITLSQIFIAASIGSRFHKRMFVGLQRTVLVAFFSTIGLILSMFVCAYIVSKITGIPFITAALAFAPGGIAEMTTTSVVLHADAPFVVVVQVFRVLVVSLVLPPIFRLLNQWGERKMHSHVS